MNYIFYNELSGAGKALTMLEKLKNKLSEYEIYSVTKLNDGVNDILAKVTQTDKVYLIGGDGTFSYFVNHYNIKDKHLILVSGGTGNDLLRNYKGTENEFYIDYTTSVNKVKCLVNEQELVILNGVGAGVDGQIIKNYHASKKHDHRTYLIKTIKAFFTYKRSKVKLIIDGEEFNFNNCYLVTVNNGKYIGGGMNICPLAKLNDGLLDVCVVHNCSLLKLLFKFPMVYKGTHIADEKLKGMVFYRQAKEVEYEGEERYFQYDGEIISEKIKRFVVRVNE